MFAVDRLSRDWKLGIGESPHGNGNHFRHTPRLPIDGGATMGTKMKRDRMSAVRRARVALRLPHRFGVFAAEKRGYPVGAASPLLALQAVTERDFSRLPRAPDHELSAAARCNSLHYQSSIHAEVMLSAWQMPSLSTTDNLNRDTAAQRGTRGGQIGGQRSRQDLLISVPAPHLVHAQPLHGRRLPSLHRSTHLAARWHPQPPASARRSFISRNRCSGSVGETTKSKCS